MKWRDFLTALFEKEGHSVSMAILVNADGVIKILFSAINGPLFLILSKCQQLLKKM